MAERVGQEERHPNGHLRSCRIFHVTSIEDFGARPDGITDAMPAIQRAANYAASLRCTCGYEADQRATSDAHP